MTTMAGPDSAAPPAAPQVQDLPPPRAHPSLRVRRLSGNEGLRVAGEVDVHTYSAWDEVLAELPVDGTPVRLDLSGLLFIDARGVAALVAAAHRLPPGIRLRLYRPPWCLRRILDVLWSTATATEIVIEEAE